MSAERQFFPLSRITARIEEVLRPAITKTFWVKAEISSGRQKGANFYCDLVEAGPDGALVAQVRCTLWGSELRAIQKSFEDQGLELKLSDGTVVGMLCRLQYHPVYGLSLRCIDMDPALALGEMELRKRAIIERLQKEGLDGRNARHPIPLLPIRIGLVTSEETAAFYDFTKTLFASPHGHEVFLASASVQGEHTERQVLRSLECLARMEVDLVVICRGGGSKTDLSWLDNEAIARAIAEHSHPVWTGIGHEIDTSVLDVVAGRAFKTPTAVAEEIVSSFDAMAHKLAQSQQTLLSLWKHRFDGDRQWLQDAREGIRLGTGKWIDLNRSRLEERRQGFAVRAERRIATSRLEGERRRDHLRLKSLTRLDVESRRLDEITNRLQQAPIHRLAESSRHLKTLARRFQPRRLVGIVEERSQQLMQRQRRLIHGPALGRIRAERGRLSSEALALRSADPERNLERGYALVKNEKGKALQKASDASRGDLIEVRLKGGEIKARVE